MKKIIEMERQLTLGIALGILRKAINDSTKYAQSSIC